jgi:hypothetical protein
VRERLRLEHGEARRPASFDELEAQTALARASRRDDGDHLALSLLAAQPGENRFLTPF